MKRDWLRANSATAVSSRLHLFVLLLFELVKRDGLHAHGAQTSYEEGCRETLTIDFAVELVGRFVDAQLFEQPGELLVADAPTHHFLFYQSLCFFFPLAIGLDFEPATVVRRFFHRSLSRSFEPSPFCCW